MIYRFMNIPAGLFRSSYLQINNYRVYALSIIKKGFMGKSISVVIRSIHSFVQIALIKPALLASTFQSSLRLIIFKF